MQKANIQIMDILLLIYTIIVGFYFFLSPQREAILFEPAKWIAFLLCYIIVRKSVQKQWCLWGILFGGVAEAIIAICQKIHWVDSFHSTFDVTGTFGNPGPLGGCLAVAITVTVGLYIEYRKHSRLRWALLLSLLLLSITIVFTESRAGWLATFAGIASFYFFRKKQQRFSFNVFQKIGIVVTVLSFIISIYYYKKDSADGRLLIWRVSAEMIVDAPLAGHGIGAFERKYMYYQGRYFNSHPDSQYSILADNIAYPYNEFLCIWIEQGIIGIILVVGIIISVFKYVSYHGYSKIYLGGFVSLLTFSMFSYPSQVLLLWLLAPILLGGMLFKKNVMHLSIGPNFRLIGYILGIACLALVAQNGYGYYSLRKKVKSMNTASSQEKIEAEVYLERHLAKLQSVPRLFNIYAQYYYQNTLPFESVHILEKAVTIIPSCELYCDLGDVYKELNQKNKAIASYLLASDMLPNRLLPKYKLFCLYREEGDTIQMRKIGFEALGIDVKVISTKTLRMKGEIKRTLGYSMRDRSG